MPQDGITESDLRAYAKEVVSQALEEGYIAPVPLLECLHYGARPELLAVMRAVARLDPAAWLRVARFATKLRAEAKKARKPRAASAKAKGSSSKASSAKPSS